MKLNDSRRSISRMVLGAILLCSVAGSLPAQDRNIAVNEVYPSDMFMVSTGTVTTRRIINVKALPAGINGGVSAVGDGVTDDSDAIIATINWVMGRLTTFWTSAGYPPTTQFWNEGWIIYFPNGTYRVTKPIVYTINRVKDPNYPNDTKREGVERLMLVGQSRAGTIIKLSDNNAAFGSGVTKPVVSFSRFDLSPQVVNNNMPAGFQFRNFTIDTGTGNPGAVGLDFYGANYARLDNVRVVGDGKIGIHLREATAHGYYSNLIVDGMNYGIYMQDRGDTGSGGAMETHGTFEYVTLNDQLTAGIYQEGVSSSLRKIQSSNGVTGLQLVAISGRLPHATILDSSFADGTSGNPAIQVDAGELYARNIAVAGYGSSVKKGATVTATGAITEYLTTAATVNNGRANSPIQSMNLPIEDYPVVPWISDFSQWANVNSFSGTAAQKIQAAMDSNKKVIYFPDHTYDIGNATIVIPPTVEQIIGCTVIIKGSGVSFSINNQSSTRLLISGVSFDNGRIQHNAARELVLETVQSRDNLYESTLTSTGTKVFANNVNGFARLPDMVDNITTWVRWNDNEKAGDYQFTASTGSKMWMFGFKSEKSWTVFRVDPGAKLEVLGGVMSRQGTPPPSSRVGIYNNNGDLSIVATTISNVSDRLWVPMIQDMQTGLATQNLAMNYAGFVARGWNSNIIVPLYASYAPATALPAVPSNLTATPGNQQAALVWNGSSGATSYKLYRSTTSNGQGSTPIVSGITGTTYTNTGLTNGTTYFYKVAAVNSNGTSALSNEAVVTPTTAVVKLTVASATASDSEALNPPSKAIDGSTSTRWSASVLSCPPAHWLQLDLGSVKTVNTVKTMFFNGLTYTYDISVSTDNVIFTTVVPSHNTTLPYQFETDAFAPISARYVRINISSKNGGGPNTKPGIIEAEVYQ